VTPSNDRSLSEPGGKSGLLTPTVEFVWLEVNPQGQFLFQEGLTGEPLTEHFAEYFTLSVLG